ncbi:methyltransferase domain-containing protein [Citrobacter sp. FP75]|uniref:methyltransferase domain-containing protein n=1 Tax=Citrobacter sp. FP75 TaxID=1852949 RepID=UPI001BCA2D3C|nr:methyltransferase domain-containing protein [Citrobacter sp. FP75]
MNKNNCIICGTDMEFYFNKEKYRSLSLASFTRSLGPIKYYKCPACGFVSSRTHQELSVEEWSNLNMSFHHYNESCDRESLGFNQPPYAEQAFMIELLAKNDIVNANAILDYAAGYGTLSNVSRKYFGREINCYDKYVINAELNYIKNPQQKKWSMVINSAMFEHILYREDLEAVNDLVSDTGSLFVHTVVVEDIPNNPDWFYIDVPVHTAVHTNRSMEVLMKQWGFSSSIYSPKSKSWVFLRKNYDEIKPTIDKINKELQTEYLFGKKGFMDYWKVAC